MADDDEFGALYDDIAAPGVMEAGRAPAGGVNAEVANAEGEFLTGAPLEARPEKKDERRSPLLYSSLCCQCFVHFRRYFLN